ncbi:acyltransferase [Streptosporangiaceae bacterium NEAU-GS5]|nr:acyltransferase [Streptosporangiaceae bacterium NEAU-GS5]
MESYADRAGTVPTVASAPPPATRRRLVGLDGIRGLAALFVVLHHCWLLSYPGFPDNSGPAWAGFLLYGHFAVVVFIVLSGFSLSVSPARHDWRLGSLRTFAYRRAWRILPPYWTALVFSLIVAWTLIPQPEQGSPTAKTVIFYGLLVQDLFGSPSPNGAFWSIAVEAQLYITLPLMLLLIRRRFGAVTLLAAVTAIVAAIGLLAPRVPAVDLFMRLTPQFAVLFAIGAVAAGVVRTPDAPWTRWLPWAALAAIIPALTLIIVNGSAWTVVNFYWVDLSIGPAVGLLLAAIATGRPRPLVRMLDTWPLRKLGSFSYSLYLIHAPIVLVLSQLVLVPRVSAELPLFLSTLALAVPVSVLAAWLFGSVFEIPFQRHRSWKALKQAYSKRGAEPAPLS